MDVNKEIERVWGKLDTLLSEPRLEVDFKYAFKGVLCQLPNGKLKEGTATFFLRETVAEDGQHHYIAKGVMFGNVMKEVENSKYSLFCNILFSKAKRKHRGWAAVECELFEDIQNDFFVVTSKGIAVKCTCTRREIMEKLTQQYTPVKSLEETKLFKITEKKKFSKPLRRKKMAVANTFTATNLF